MLNEMIDLAKTDHLLWRWRIESMLAGRTQLEANKVKDHTVCRLGKWYFGGRTTTICREYYIPSFRFDSC